MKCIVLSVVLLSTLVHAQYRDNAVAREAYNVADEVQRQAPYLSADEQQDLMEHLRAIRQILRGEGSSYGNQSYICTPRDNDGHNPYVLGLRDGLNVTRISGTTFETKQQCDAT